MTASPLFRPARAGDLPVIVAMLADDRLGAKRERPGLPLDPRYGEAFAALEADPNQRVIVAEVAGAVVGTLQLTVMRGIARLGATRGQIEAVRVASSHRGHGLGSTMILWAIEECRRRGCVLVRLTSDKAREDAHRVQDRLGFKASHVGDKMTL